MNFDPNMLLQTMYNVHVNCTLNKPICYHEFEKIIIKRNILTHKFLLKCCDDCYNEYKKTEQANLRGSVDINPIVWVNIFIQYAIMSEEKDKLYIPNGCCNTDNCGIKKFYEIVYDYFKEKQN